MKTQILEHKQVENIIRRMAYQIYENHFAEKELVVAAIEGQGVFFAKLLQQELEQISKIKIKSLTISLDKKLHALGTVTLSNPKVKFQNATIILVDDVLKSGRTMMYAMSPFLSMGVKSLHTAVLIDRSHKSFPVAADFIGMSLNTTLQEHVSVVVSKGKINVFLE